MAPARLRRRHGQRPRAWLLCLATLALLGCLEQGPPSGVSYLCADESCSHPSSELEAACIDNGGPTCSFYLTQEDCIFDIDERDACS